MRRLQLIREARVVYNVERVERAFRNTRRVRRWCCALLLAAPIGAAATIDFVEGVDLGPLGISARYAVDRQGDILIAGLANSCTLPVMNALAACGAIWVAKLDPTGRRLLFATYLGGANPNHDGNLAGVAADAAGNIVIAADTLQSGWLTSNALQPANQGVRNLYLVKLTADGSKVIFATYLGGRGSDYAASLALDDAGAVYLLGRAGSSDFPTTPQSLPRVPNSPSLILKLSADGQSLVYASFVPWVWGGPFYGPPLTPLSVDSSGAVVMWPNFVLRTPPEVWRLSADGSTLDRIPFPDNEVYENPAAWPTPGGGFVLTGSVRNGFLPVTGDAAQGSSGFSPYARVEGGPPVPVPLPAHTLAAFAVDPENRSRLYAATDGGLFASSDNGWSWSLLAAGSSTAIAIDPFDSNRLYLGSAAGGLLRSTDGGQTWQAILGANVTSVAADSTTPGLLYAAGGSVFRSTDGGDSWDSQNFSPPGIPGYPHNVSTIVGAVTVDPAHPGTAYAFAANTCICIGVPLPATIFQTRDGGATWKTAAMFFPQFGTGSGGDVDPATGDVYVIVNGQLVVYRGGDFTNKVVLSVPPAETVVFDPANPGTVYAELTDSSLIASADMGMTWSPVTQFNGGYLEAVSAGGVFNLKEPANAQDAYVFVLGPDGAIQYGSYFGGGNLTVNTSASLGRTTFVAGSTGPGLPLSNPAQGSFGGGRQDGFVAAFDENGKLIWSSYLGGPGDDTVNAVLPLADGSAIVIGTTTDFTNLPNIQPSPLGSSTTFIAHVRP